MVQQKVSIILFIFIPRTWFQNRLKALSWAYRMGLEPEQTDQSEHSYGQMKLATHLLPTKIRGNYFYFLHL